MPYPDRATPLSLPALLVELSHVLTSPEYRDDPVGVLASFGELVAGQVDLDACYSLATEPTESDALTTMAMALARHGAFRNADLRRRFPMVSDETVRRRLSALVDAGLLVRAGTKSGTYYAMAGKEYHGL